MRVKGKISPVWSLWLLLSVALMIFIGLSLSKDLKVGSYTLSKGSFDEVLNPSLTLVEEPEKQTDTLSAIMEKEIAEPDTTVHNVLVFGDSMTHHLAMSIAKYGTKNSYKVTGVTWESSSIPGWANSGKIKEYIRLSSPDFIIISLGSNEMELKHFERRLPDVKKIVEQIDSIPFIWVGPPLWKEDKGVYKMLEKGVQKDQLFKIGTDFEIPRGGDHVHPTRKGADVWADTLMRWIKYSSHPILSEKPDSGISTRGHKFIYLHPDD